MPYSPSAMASETIIVGGGLSGTLVAIQLLRRFGEGDRITVIERSGECGRGIAYGTQNIEHLLNVPAMGMTAFPDAPEDFVNWWSEQAGLPPTELRTSFAPRMVYSRYVQARLREAIEASPATFEVLAENAVEVRRDEEGRFHVRMESGAERSADSVVLALGNHAPASPGILAQVSDTTVYKSNPWKPCTLADLDPESDVLLVGTGLTMVDSVVSLVSGGHRGNIYAFSRRGLLPQRHILGMPPRKLDLIQTPANVRGLAREIVNAARENVKAGSDWRPVIDGLRAETPKIWARLPWDERRRFLRRLTAYWDIHRHRIAPEIHDLLAKAQGRGQLRIYRGNLTSVECADGRAQLTLQTPTGPVDLKVSRIVNCTGPDTNLRRSRIPVVESLIANELSEYDPLGMGLMVDDLGACSAKGLYAIGPVCRGCRWETTAAPEIRVQADAIAREICPRS